MKAKKSPNPLSASLKPGKPSNVVLVQVRRPENQESQWGSSNPKVTKWEEVSLTQRWGGVVSLFITSPDGMRLSHIERLIYFTRSTN